MSMVAWGALALGLCGVLTGKPTTNFVSHEESVIQAEESIDPAVTTSTIIEGDGCSCSGAVDCSCDACLQCKPGLLARIAGKIQSLKYSMHASACGCATDCGCDACCAPRLGLIARIKGAFHHPAACSYACDDICGFQDGDVIEGEIADAIPSEVTVPSTATPCPSCGHYIAPNNKPVVIQPAPELPPAKPAVKVSTPSNNAGPSPARTAPVVGRKREGLTPVPVEPPVTIKQMSALLPTEIPSIGHAENFSWVQGELHHAQVRGGIWIVRYLPLEQTDTNGGCIVLAKDGRIEQFREGDLVQVSGEIIRERSANSLGGPVYRMRTITLISPAANR